MENLPTQLSIQGIKACPNERHYKILSVSRELRKHGIKYSWLQKNSLVIHSDISRPSFCLSMDVTDVPNARWQLEYYKILSVSSSSLVNHPFDNVRIPAVYGIPVIPQLVRFGFLGKEVANA